MKRSDPNYNNEWEKQNAEYRKKYKRKWYKENRDIVLLKWKKGFRTLAETREYLMRVNRNRTKFLKQYGNSN